MLHCADCHEHIEVDDAIEVRSEIFHLWCAPHWAEDLDDWRVR